MEVKLAFNKRSDGVFVFSTGIVSPKQDIDDIENSLSLVVDFSRFTRSLSRKAFYQSLKAQGLADDVLGLAPRRTFNEWCIAFKTIEAKERFAEKEELPIDGLVGEIRECGVNYVHGKVYWLPVQFPQDRLAAVLGHFGEIKRLSRDKAHEDGCAELFNGLRSFTLKLSEGYRPEDLPHKCVIDTQECLIKITERPSQCFRCAKTGHDAKFCPTNNRVRPFNQAQRSVGDVLAPYNYTNKVKETDNSPIPQQAAEIDNNTAPKSTLPQELSTNSPPSPAHNKKPATTPDDSYQHHAKKSKPSSSWADEMEECEDLSEAESTASSGRYSDSKPPARNAFLRLKQEEELQDALHTYRTCCVKIDAGKYARSLQNFQKCIAKEIANSCLEPPASYADYIRTHNVPSHIISKALNEAGELALAKFRLLQQHYKDIKSNIPQGALKHRSTTK